MLISTDEYPESQKRLEKINEAVVAELRSLGYPLNTNGTMGGVKIMIMNVTDRHYYSIGNGHASHVLVYIGRDLKRRFEDQRDYTKKIVSLKEAKKGFETDRIIKAFIKHYEANKPHYEKWEKDVKYKSDIRQSCRDMNRTYKKTNCELTTYTDHSRRLTIELKEDISAEQLEAIVRHIDHEMMYTKD